MKIYELLKYGKEELTKYNIEDVNIKAKLLLMHLLEVSKEYLIINSNKEVISENIVKYKKGLEELINGKPIQYITNIQEFMGLEFYVDKNVLIPQPDTEILVEEVIKLSNSFDKEISILDMCTGSGAIAISLKKYISNVQITAVDVSETALEIAKKNAINHGVDIEFIKSDMFDNLLNRRYDLIVSNPPYIETEIINNLSKEVQNEPKLALDGGEDGLKFYKIFSKEAYMYLNKGGYLFLEIGYNQKESVMRLLNNEFFYDVKCVKDISGLDRVIIARKKEE